MKLFLDSSAIIEFMKNDSNAIEIVGAADEIYTSTVCAYEVLVGEKFQSLKGRHTSYQKVMGFFETIATLPPSLPDANEAAYIMAKLMLKGITIDPLDTVIAAQALATGAVLLTKNEKHFKAVQTVSMLKAEYI